MMLDWNMASAVLPLAFNPGHEAKCAKKISVLQSSCVLATPSAKAANSMFSMMDKL
jgi:hypothetical protein